MKRLYKYKSGNKQYIIKADYQNIMAEYYVVILLSIECKIIAVTDSLVGYESHSQYML